jgi:hypothetical protein
MFEGATSFNQSLGDWELSSVTILFFIFENSGCPVVDGEKSCF